MAAIWARATLRRCAEVFRSDASIMVPIELTRLACGDVRVDNFSLREAHELRRAFGTHNSDDAAELAAEEGAGAGAEPGCGRMFTCRRRCVRRSGSDPSGVSQPIHDRWEIESAAVRSPSYSEGLRTVGGHPNDPSPIRQQHPVWLLLRKSSQLLCPCAPNGWTSSEQYPEALSTLSVRTEDGGDGGAGGARRLDEVPRPGGVRQRAEGDGPRPRRGPRSAHPLSLPPCSSARGSLRARA